MAEDSSDGVASAEEAQPPRASTYKGRSCKGCLYYSSLLKSDSRKPICVGISRSLPHVPSYIVGESEVEATKDGRNLSDFKYACVGYSVFLDNKDNPDEKQENRAELPFCAGIELLIDRRTTTTTDHVPAHASNKEDGTVRSPPRPYKPAHSVGEEFFGRFTRNAGLVASGVMKNLNRVGNYIKDYFDDMYPYRRRPK
ncbi:hypothetical protein IHE45_11G016000 [Dioscorea alata]|uniref:Uncharacterized protein n=1 Tax=Dioscorea alata TaxID=55571 RepID=A0ACB7V547_DIOAL|nr:hypothetical protein IHE45_11G016000 [Dioscorea alata]